MADVETFIAGNFPTSSETSDLCEASGVTVASQNSRTTKSGVPVNSRVNCTMKLTAAERTHLCHFMREMLGGGFRGPAHSWHREHGLGMKEYEPLAIFFCHVEVIANPELYPPWIEQFEIEPTEPWVPPAESTESFRARIAEAKSELRKLGLGEFVES